MHNYILPLTFIFSLISLNTVLATCVVISRTDKKITIGADSRRQLRNIQTGSISGYEDTNCKIRRTADFYYTLVGVDDAAQISAAEVVAHEHLPLEQTVERFGAKMIEHYNKYLQNFKENNSKDYQIHFKQNKIFTEMAFFKYENNQPLVYIIRFKNTNQYFSDVEVVYEIEENPALAVLGYSSYYNQKSNSEKNVLIGRAKTLPIPIIKDIIDKEHNRYPDMIGGATDILEITSEGNHWIARKSNCHD